MKRLRAIDTRRMAQLLAILFLAPICAPFAASASASVKHEETSQKRIELQGERRLLFFGQSGDVTVVGERGRGDIHLKVIKRVSAETREEAEELASLMGFEVERTDGEIRIRTEYPKRTEIKKNIFSYLLQRGPQMSMEIFLAIPAVLETDVNTASGDISVSNISATVRINAASGDVEVSNVEDAVVISVASGDISVRNIEGETTLSSASGDISGKNLLKDVEVNTASGEVELADVAGDLRINTTSGDATIDGVGSVIFSGISGSGRFIDVRGGVQATAASGDLSFRLVPDRDADYTVRTSSGSITLRFLKLVSGGYVLKAGTTTGDIEANLPIKISKVGRHHITGVVREGKSKIILETASGDITILEPEE